MLVSTLKRPATSLTTVPPMHNGDQLTRAEFERVYQAHPEIKKAELIEGTVYMPSPTRYREHGNFLFNTISWLGMYSAATPGVEGSDNATLRLDFENEPQPDALLRLPPYLGGNSWIAEDGYLEGAPELIVEVAASSASYDLNQKKRAYARNGVPEYMVLLAYEQRVVWFILREGIYHEQQPNEKGVLKSEIFPGLWLLPDTLLRGEMSQVLQILQQGLASPAHKIFTATLTAKKGKPQ